MRNPRIYTAQALTLDTTIALDETAANHVGRVLRMEQGDALRLFNGDGKDYTAHLSSVGKKQVLVTISDWASNPTESPLRTVLGQVMSRGDRMDYAIQKATEMGVSEIAPLSSERCEVRLSGDREDKRVERWQQIAVSAAEQCGRAVVPTVLAPQTLSQWIASLPPEMRRLVLHHHCAQPLASLARPSAVALLVGPEGGLSEAEVSAAIAQQFVPVALGPRVLRTETAPVAALAVLHWLWGDFQPITTPPTAAQA